MKLWLEAIRNFLKHYAQTFRDVWKVRHKLDAPVRTADELAFLPAHLELIETPVSPLPHWSMRAIMLFALLALLWAMIGKIDIVAVATGKTITSGRTRIIQPLEPSIIKAIYVKDGQHVTEGEILVELDATTASAELQKMQEALNINRLAQQRYSALLKAMQIQRNLNAQSKSKNDNIPALIKPIDDDMLPTLNAIADIPQEQFNAEQALLTSQYRSFYTQVEKQRLLILQKQAEIHTTTSQVTKISRLLSIAQNKTDDYKRLYDKKFASKHEWLQQEQTQVELQNELFVQRNRLEELKSGLNIQKQELDALFANYINDTQEKLKQARDNITQYEQETAKSQQRKDILKLVSPVNGIVQQLAIHTVGGVVTEAQPLLAIVPDDEQLEVEVTIDNKDIGFITVGQTAAIKIESFPYTRYGLLEGEVENISLDAVQDEQRGLVFPAKIRLKQSYIIVDGIKINLIPGMVVTAEIKTRQRRVIDYFLSPLKRYANESLYER